MQSEARTGIFSAIEKYMAENSSVVVGDEGERRPPLNIKRWTASLFENSKVIACLTVGSNILQ